MILTPNHKTSSPNPRQSRESINSSGKRYSKVLPNNIQRPSKLKSEDLKILTSLPEKQVKDIELNKDTKKIIKTNKMCSKKNMDYGTHVDRNNLAHELEDPANEYLRVDIQRIMQIGTEVFNLEVEYKRLDEIKVELKEEIQKLSLKDNVSNIKQITAQEYSSYLKGLSKVIDEFEGKEILDRKFLSNKSVVLNTDMNENIDNEESQIRKNNNNISNNFMTNNNILKIIKEDERGEERNELEQKKKRKGYRPNSPPANNNKPINSPKNNDDNLKRIEEMLDGYYNNLGHDYFTKVLKIFEKYCHHGKVNPSIGMDYSQFSTFMQQNELYDGVNITKTNSELIFNKIKGLNKLIDFENFIKIIIEFAKKEFPWEKDTFRAFKYFFNRRVNHLKCLERTYEERNMERFYFFLEYDDYQHQIKKYLQSLKRNFIKYKHSDLRISECISTEGFIKMCKDLTIIPVFMSAKEILGVINYVKYHKKSLFPTGNINFCSYVEVLCLVAFQSFDKYTDTTEEKDKKYVDHIDKLNIFLKFLVEKIK